MYCPAMLKKIDLSIACSILVGHISLVYHPLIRNVREHAGQHSSVTSLYTEDLGKNFNPATAVCLGYRTDDVYLMNNVHARI